MGEFSALATTVSGQRGQEQEAQGVQPGGSLDNGGAAERQTWTHREIFLDLLMECTRRCGKGKSQVKFLAFELVGSASTVLSRELS